MLYKSSLQFWQGFQVLATLLARGASRCDWKASEAGEEDLDGVEAHLMKRLEVKVLARIGRKSSSEVGFLKRVLRHDAVTDSFFWCSGKRFVQDAAATLHLTGRSHESKTADTPSTNGAGATPRDGDQKLDESETAVFWSAPGISDVRRSG